MKTALLAALTFVSTSPTYVHPECGRKVVAYEASWCGYCREMNRFFAANGITYTSIDVDTMPGAKEFLRDRIHVDGIPVTIIDDHTVVVGYDPDALRRNLCLP